MEEYAGTVSNTYEETQDPIDELTTAMNQMKDLGYEIGEAAAPIIVEALKVLKDVITDLKAKWDELTPAQQDMIIKFALVAAAVGPVLVVVGQLVSIIGAVAAAAPVMGAALAALSGPGAIVIGIIAAVIAIGVLLGRHWDEVCAWANNLKERVSLAFEGLKANISSKIQAAKDKVSSIFSTMRSDVAGKVGALKNTISNTFSNIKTAISSKMDAARQAVSGAISRIKGILSGSISFPHITLPHFTVTGSPPFGLGGHGTPPHISVEWYAKAMKQPYVLDGATIFGMMGNKFLGGGETGKEVIMGYDTFRNMGGDVNINMVVNAAPGMDTTQLANIVARKINRQVRELA